MVKSKINKMLVVLMLLTFITFNFAISQVTFDDDLVYSCDFSGDICDFDVIAGAAVAGSSGTCQSKLGQTYSAVDGLTLYKTDGSDYIGTCMQIGTVSFNQVELVQDFDTDSLNLTLDRETGGAFLFQYTYLADSNPGVGLNFGAYIQTWDGAIWTNSSQCFYTNTNLAATNFGGKMYCYTFDDGNFTKIRLVTRSADFSTGSSDGDLFIDNFRLYYIGAETVENGGTGGDPIDLPSGDFSGMASILVSMMPLILMMRLIDGFEEIGD